MIKNAKDVARQLPISVDVPLGFIIGSAADVITLDRLRVVELVREMANEYPDGDAAVDIAERLEKMVRAAGK